jgi:hypothetical protein
VLAKSLANVLVRTLLYGTGCAGSRRSAAQKKGRTSLWFYASLGSILVGY